MELEAQTETDCGHAGPPIEVVAEAFDKGDRVIRTEIRRMCANCAGDLLDTIVKALRDA